MSDPLGSAVVPEPGAGDHVRGPHQGALVIEYADFECPFCAMLAPLLHEREVRHVFRHFPVRSAHSRAWATSCAAEAAGRQGRFWEMHDLLLGDQGRLEDPHLWEYARRLELDIERFDSDRRNEEISARIRADFRSGVRAGVVTTPTLFLGGAPHAGREALAAVGELRML